MFNANHMDTVQPILPRHISIQPPSTKLAKVLHTTAAPFIDHTGKLDSAVDQRLPHVLPPTVMTDVKRFLLTPLVNHPQLSTVADLLCAEKECADLLQMPIHAFKIVGSTVFYLLRSMLQDLLQERLKAYPGAAELLCTGESWFNLTKPPHDGDIRSETPTATIADLHARLNVLLNQECSLEERRSSPAPFDKCILEKDDDYILIGNSKLDYCLGAEFKRSHLFENTNLQIIIFPESLTRDASQIKIALFSQNEQGIQALVDRGFKYLRITHPQSVNYRGAMAWVSAIVAGYTPVDVHAYSLLQAKLLVKHEPRGDWGGRIAKLIISTVKAHHAADDMAKAALALQFELSNAAVRNDYFKPIYQEFLGRELWQQLFLEPPLHEPLVALRMQHHLSGEEMSALLQVGALLALGLPNGSGKNAYRIALTSVDGKMAVRYTLAEQHHLLVSVDIAQLKDVLAQSSLCKPNCELALCSFLDGCYKPEAIQVATLAPALAGNQTVIEELATGQALTYAKEYIASDRPFLQMVGISLLVALVATNNIAAEDKLFTEALPKLISAQSNFAKWGYTIATALLRHVAASHQYAAIDTHLLAAQNGSQTAWWQALTASCYYRYCSLAARQIAQLLTTCAYTSDCGTLVWYVKTIVQYRPLDSTRLLPLWQSSLKALKTLPITSEQARGLFSCCKQMGIASFATKLQVDFAIALFHTVAEDHPQLALDIAGCLLPAEYRARERLRLCLSAKVALQMAACAVIQADYLNATIAFKTAWQQLHLAGKSPLAAKRRWRRAALSCLQQLPAAEALTLGKDILLAPYSRALLGKNTWEHYLIRWLQGCYQLADLSMLVDVLPSLLAQLQIRHKQQRVALYQLASWMLKLDYFPPLKLSAGRKLLQVCAITNDKNFNWLKLVTALEHIHDHRCCEGLFQHPPPIAYTCILEALWQRAADHGRSIQWLEKLPAIVTDELAQALFSCAQRLRQKAAGIAIWKWLSALKNHLGPQHAENWQKIAKAVAKDAMVNEQKPLAAKMIVEGKLSALDFLVEFSSLYQVLLESDLHTDLLVTLVNHYATSLDDTAWDELWRTLAVSAKPAAIKAIYTVYAELLTAQKTSVTAHCLLALATIHSKNCPVSLQSLLHVSALLDKAPMTTQQRSAVYFWLLTVALKYSASLSVEVAVELYQLIELLPITGKKQQALRLDCLEIALQQDAWPLVAKITQALFKAHAQVPISAKIRDLLLNNLHRCPYHDQAVNQILCKALIAIQHDYAFDDTAITLSIYKWVIHLPIYSKAEEEMYDNVALKLLVNLVDVSTQVAQQLACPATSQLLQRRAEMIIAHPQLVCIYATPYLNIIADEMAQKWLHHCTLHNVLLVAEETSEAETRLRAIEAHIQCFPDFPAVLPSEEYTKRFVNILVMVLLRDKAIVDFEKYYKIFQANYTKYQPPANASASSMSVALANQPAHYYYCQLLLALAESPLPMNGVLQSIHIHYTYEVLLFLLDNYQKDGFIKPSAAEIFELIIAVYFHVYRSYIVHAERYLQQMGTVQRILRQHHFLEDEQLHMLELYIAEGCQRPVGITDKQLENATVLLFTYADKMPRGYDICAYSVRLEAFKGNFERQSICYQKLIDKVHATTYSTPGRVIVAYENLAKILIVEGFTFGKNQTGPAWQQALAIHTQQLKGVCQAILEQWNATQQFCIEQQNLANFPLSYLQALARSYFFKSTPTCEIADRWQIYSQLLHIGLDLFLNSIERYIYVAKNIDQLILPVEIQLARLHDLVVYTEFEVTLEQFLPLQKQLINSILLKFSEVDASPSHPNRLRNLTAYTKYLLQLFLNGKSPFANFATLHAIVPARWQNLLVAASLLAPVESQLASLTSNELDKGLQTGSATDLIRALSNIKAYSNQLRSKKLATLAVLALTYLYVVEGAKDKLKLYLRQLITVCPSIQRTPAAHAIAKAVDGPWVLAEPYWDDNPRLAIYLLLLGQLTHTEYVTCSRRKIALKLAYSLLDQIAQKYSDQKMVLTEAFCKVLTSPLAHCKELAPQHLQYFKETQFARSQSYLCTQPKLLLRMALFCHCGQIQDFPLEIKLRPDEKIAVFEDLVIYLLQAPSWYAFTYACNLASNYQHTVYGPASKQLLNLCARFVYRCVELLKIDAPPHADDSLPALLGLFYDRLPATNNLERGVFSTRLPVIPATKALLMRLTEVLLSHLEARSMQDWQKQGAVFDYLVNALILNGRGAELLDIPCENIYKQQGLRTLRLAAAKIKKTGSPLGF